MMKDMNKPPMKSYRIPMGRGGTHAVIDIADLPLVAKHRWRKSAIGNTVYATTCQDGKTVYMHRLIMGVTDQKVLIDHVDRDGLNNRRSNLRIADRSLNAHNCKVREDSTTGIRGVSSYWRKGKSRGYVAYCAYVNVNGKRTILVQGTRDINKAVAARKAYEEAHPELFQPGQKDSP